MFEKKSFDGGSASGGFKVREIVLGLISAVALVACIVFLGLYAHQMSKSSSDTNTNKQGRTMPMMPTTMPTTMPSTMPTTAPKPTSKTCDTATCLETTAYVRSLMNVSVDPCSDFYTYACGNWPKRFPLDGSHFINDVEHKMYHDNEKKLRKLLESPKLRDVPWGAERKAKDLFSSCMDDFRRGAASGKTFIDKVLQPTGGWYVLQDNFDESSWDLLDHIEKVHVDFWTDVLFAVDVTTDWTRRNQKVITLRSAGLGMYSYYYYISNSASYNKTRTDYKTFMRKFGSLLVRDSGISIDEATKNTRLDTFVNDVMQVETMLANVLRGTRFTRFRNRRVMIKDINRITRNVFNWVSFFGYMFDKPKVTENSWVLIPQTTYLSRMATGITNLGANKNRMLNNYFTWTMGLNYIAELSSEYILAARQYYNDRTGVTEYPSTWEICFTYVSTKMEEAMSHLFIQQHFADGNKEKVHEISDYIKRVLVNNIINMQFMDDATRRYAIDKVKATTDKFGYPDYIANTDEIDLIYASLEVHSTDYFQNVLNMNKFNKVDLNNQLNTVILDRTKWTYSSYWTFLSLRQNWNQLSIPSGLLQHPIYDYKLSHYLNFGSIGSMIANAYVKTIGTTGSRYAKNGTRVRDASGRYTQWWSNSTIMNYKTGHDCMGNLYTNVTLGTYTNPFSKETMTVTVSPTTALAYGDTTAMDVGGIKQAYYAYKLWMDDNGPEQKAPIVGLSNEQMFFIAYAQTKCYIRDDTLSFWYYRYGSIPDSLGLNGAVSQLDEFSKAFNCPMGASLNPPDKCTVF